VTATSTSPARTEEAAGADDGARETVPARQLVGALRVAAFVAVYVSTAAELARALTSSSRAAWYWYLILGGIYLVILTLTIWRPPGRTGLVHVILAVQCVIVLGLLSLDPQLDFLTGLFVPLAFAAALFFTGRVIWIWVAILSALILGSLMIYLGPLRGLSLGLTSVALTVVFASYAVITREVDTSRKQSQLMVAEIEATNTQLQEYAGQADELATFGQRDRVARDLNESVAQTVAGILADAREARAALAAVGADDDGDPAEQGDTAARLAALQTRTQQALKQMRDLIGELRPKAAEPGDPAGASGDALTARPTT
jgi:signal transduction histidine kinase